jgi:argininosuccinate synthase
MQRTVLGFSGSAASAAAIGWLTSLGHEVVTVTVDVGQGDELAAIREQALALGAIRAHVIDGREELVRDYLLPSLQAGALLDGHALVSSLIGKRLVDLARMENASSIAHAANATGEAVLAATIHSLNAEIEVIPVLASLHASGEIARHQALHVAASHDIRVEASVWGRRIHAATVPDEVFTLTRDPADCPPDAALVDIAFVEGVPVSANGVEMSLNEMMESLETIAGAHGVGRLPSGETVLEAPAARVLSAAHDAIERTVLGQDLSGLKTRLAQLYSNAILTGQWFSEIREAIDAFVRVTNRRINGKVRLSLEHGQCAVVSCEAGSSQAANRQSRAVA